MSVQVKICGLTNLEDARAALDAGADLLGFIFYPKSLRYIQPQQVQAILENLAREQGQVITVGVFVNTPVEEVQRILDLCGLDLAQLHGEETPEDMNVLDGRGYKALRPRSAEEALELSQAYLQATHPMQPALLLDAYHPDLRGGTGITGDWNAAVGLAKTCSLLLAGGLNPTNVVDAIRAVQPWGVDVSSGVECAPGKKDHAALAALIRAAKAV